MGVVESLRGLDRRVLGVEYRGPGRHLRRSLLEDARAGRPVDPELCREVQAWAEYAVGERRRRQWLIGLAAVVGFDVVLVVVGWLTGAAVYGGVGAGIGTAVGSLLSRRMDREEAREVQEWLPDPDPDER